MVTLGTMHAKWLLYRGGLLIEVGGALGLLDFGTCPTGWHIKVKSSPSLTKVQDPLQGVNRKSKIISFLTFSTTQIQFGAGWQRTAVAKGPAVGGRGQL